MALVISSASRIFTLTFRLVIWDTTGATKSMTMVGITTIARKLPLAPPSASSRAGPQADWKGKASKGFDIGIGANESAELRNACW